MRGCLGNKIGRIRGGLELLGKELFLKRQKFRIFLDKLVGRFQSAKGRTWPSS